MGDLSEHSRWDYS